MNWDIPLFKIYWDDEDIEMVKNAIQRGRFWAIGPNIERFEERLSEYIGTKYAVVFNSGTSALHAALLAHGIGQGDEVIVPSFTFIATANAPLFVGARPVFADIEGTTYGLDPDDVIRKVTPKTKAIIPVHYGGCPCLIGKLKKVADEHELLLIEDAAESLGTAVNGKKVGTFGDCAVLSFCANKIITTGEGGAVVTNSTDINEKTKLIRSHGRAENTNYFSSTEPMDYVTLGYNFRMSAPQAALGLAQLERLDYLVAARRYIAGQYEAVIRDEKCEWLVPPHVPEGRTHSYWCYSCDLKEEVLGVDWREFRKAFIRNGGDGLYGLWTPVHLEPVFRTMAFCGTRDRAPHFDPRYKGRVKAYEEGDCPNAETFRKTLCLFKTGMQTLDGVKAQVDALRSTIQYYA